VTENARKLFELYWKDAGNWSGNPLVGGNVELLGAKQDRGLITQLKKEGLITTEMDEGNSWICFTREGEVFGIKNFGKKTWYGGWILETEEAEILKGGADGS